MNKQTQIYIYTNIYVKSLGKEIIIGVIMNVENTVGDAEHHIVFLHERHETTSG